MDGIITSMTKKWGTFDEAASDSIARGLLAEAIEKMGEVIPDSKVRAELATKIRNAPDATSLQVLLKELDEKHLRGTLGQSNTSAVDWQDITAARNSWTAARNPATTPPAGTPTTAPLAAAFAPNRTALPSGQGTTSTDISAALMTQFDTQYGTGKRQDQTYTKALREWVNTEFNSDHTLRDEVLQKLTSAGGFSFPSN